MTPEFFSRPACEVIKDRTSWRSYSDMELPADAIQAIEEFISSCTEGIFGNKISFKIISKSYSPSGEKVKLGTYGFISGARYFIGAAVDIKGMIFEDYGYLLEKIILKLTDMGLATCWLGGTFDRGEIGLLLGSERGQSIPAVVVFGYATENRNMRDRFIRAHVDSRSRLEWDKIFYKDDFNTTLSKADAGEYAEILDMLRIAPSASNKQPWRIVKAGDAFHFFLLRTKGYNKAFKSSDLQRIDMGICMSHFHIVAAESKLFGKFVKEDPSIDSAYGMEYIASWIK